MAFFLVMPIYAVLLCIVVFVLLFGESQFFQGTIVSSCHWWISTGIFMSCANGVEFVFGSRGKQCLSGSYKLCFEKPNPILQVFYLVILGGSYLTFATSSLHLIPGPYLSSSHSWGAPIAVLFALLSFVLASFSDPGVVTKDNVKRMLHAYPLLTPLYAKRSCTTCKMPKPPRSKHCRVCNRCIARFDHHCGWLNSCVGENNLRFFLLFLFSNLFVCAYGAFLLAAIMAGEVKRRGVMAAIEAQYPNQALKFTTWFPQLANWLAVNFSSQIILMLFACVIFTMLVSFLGYHIYLVLANLTTNETFKWSEYQYWMAEEATKYLQQREAKLSPGKDGPSSRGNALGDVDQVNGDGSDEEGVEFDFSKLKIVDDGPAGCCSWGQSSKEVVSWVDPSSVPRENAYSLGIWSNILEVLYPLSHRRGLQKMKGKLQ